MLTDVMLQLIEVDDEVLDDIELIKHDEIDINE